MISRYKSHICAFIPAAASTYGPVHCTYLQGLLLTVGSGFISASLCYGSSRGRHVQAGLIDQTVDANAGFVWR
ncbi:hypothetical protein VTN02DRAFT_1147 [Thermoascus thermophilus]